MAERLHQELLAVPALDQLHASSADVVDALKMKTHDRKLERRAEKIENMDREAMRKREDSFRSDFMQIVASELARLGAPAMISWQKLIFDKDCCAQAFRLLLTRIKSSRRISASATSSSQRTLSRDSKQPQSEESEESGEYANDGFELEDDHAATNELQFPCQRVNFKTKLRSSVRKSTPAGSDDGGGWNFDISASASGREPGNNNAEVLDDDSRERFGLPSITGDARMVIERRVSSTKQHALMQAAKLKKNQLQSLQNENSALAEENARLKEEITHLEAVNTMLQNDISGTEPADTFDYRRMRLVQAQNMQLQRQTNQLQNAIAEIKQVESNLLVALNRWRDVVEVGVEEARTAGADQNGPNENGKDVKWMMAVPDALMNELKRVEGQVHSASAAINGAVESKLRVSGASSAFLRSSATCLRTTDVFPGGQHQQLAHLRLDRLKALEGKLVRLGKALDSFTSDVLRECPPRIRSNNVHREAQHDVSALIEATRNLLLELGALGAVVSITPPQPSSESGDTEDQITAMSVYKTFASASGGKEREKNLKAMMTQLHARHLSMENEMNACRQEAQYWRAAWQTQEEIISLLAKRVSHLGDKKIQWFEANVSEPLKQIMQVFESFQRAQLQGTSRQNPYLPLLVETMESQQSLLVDGLSQWRSNSGSIEAQVNTLIDEYEANRAVLADHHQ